MATISRTLIKAIIFRIFVTLLGFVVAYVVTRDINISLRIFVIHALAATVLYIVHEKIWERIDWGIRKE